MLQSIELKTWPSAPPSGGDTCKHTDTLPSIYVRISVFETHGQGECTLQNIFFKFWILSFLGKIVYKSHPPPINSQSWKKLFRRYMGFSFLLCSLVTQHLNFHFFFFFMPHYPPHSPAFSRCPWSHLSDRSCSTLASSPAPRWARTWSAPLASSRPTRNSWRISRTKSTGRQVYHLECCDLASPSRLQQRLLLLLLLLLFVRLVGFGAVILNNANKHNIWATTKRCSQIRERTMYSANYSTQPIVALIPSQLLTTVVEHLKSASSVDKPVYQSWNLSGLLL